MSDDLTFKNSPAQKREAESILDALYAVYGTKIAEPGFRFDIPPEGQRPTSDWQHLMPYLIYVGYTGSKLTWRFKPEMLDHIQRCLGLEVEGPAPQVGKPSCGRHVREAYNRNANPSFRSDWNAGCPACDAERFHFLLSSIEKAAGESSTEEIVRRLNHQASQEDQFEKCSLERTKLHDAIREAHRKSGTGQGIGDVLDLIEDLAANAVGGDAEKQSKDQPQPDWREGLRKLNELHALLTGGMDERKVPEGALEERIKSFFEQYDYVYADRRAAWDLIQRAANHLGVPVATEDGNVAAEHRIRIVDSIPSQLRAAYTRGVREIMDSWYRNLGYKTYTTEFVVLQADTFREIATALGWEPRQFDKDVLRDTCKAVKGRVDDLLLLDAKRNG